VIAVWEYGGSSCLYFRRGNLHTFGGLKVALLGIECGLVSRVLEVLSSVEFGVNGPHTGSDHRHRGAEASQHDGDQPITRPRQRYPGLDSSNRNSRDRRPKAKKEKYARDRRNQIREAGHQSSGFQEMRGPEIDQNGARQHALK
jgi:hypothetical protein